MGFNGVNVKQINGGLGRKKRNDDGVCLLVIGGAVATGQLALKVAKELLTIENAEAIGINASYDDANTILAHHHIDEFFRLSPNGNLFVVLDDGTLTTAEIKAILLANQSISAVGFVRNGAAPANMATYVSNYQAMINELRTDNRNVASVLVEGDQFTAATLVAAYPDARAYNAQNVSIVIGQDPLIAALDVAHKNYAAIGAALGMLSVRSVNENLGAVNIKNKPDSAKAQRDYPLTDVARSRWLSAALQDGKLISVLSSAEIQALNDKGYVFAGNFNAYPGVFFRDSHTCIVSSSDYSRIENNRVWDKGADLIRFALLPRVKGNLLKDPETGYIRESEATELEVLAGNSLNGMLSSEEISGYDIYIDPKQDLLDDVPLKVKAQIVFNNIIHQFDVDLGLTNKLS